MMQSIHIYKDKGVGTTYLPLLLQGLKNFKVSFISAKEVISTPWELETNLFIIPGGADLPYHHSLKGEGNKRISDYVEKGGAFLGICAGAYYGSSFVEFDKGLPLEVLGERELSFFPGRACGPAYGAGSFCYNSEKGSKGALISNNFSGDSLRCYYNGGCYFLKAEEHPEVKILSKYLEIEGEPAAIISVKKGKGKVILSGVHIEMVSFPTKNTLSKEVAALLIPDEEKREVFFETILSELIN